MNKKIVIMSLLIVVFYSCNNIKSKEQKFKKITNYENMNLSLESADVIGKMQFWQRVNYIRRSYSHVAIDTIYETQQGKKLSIQNHLQEMIFLEKNNNDSIYLIEKEIYKKILTKDNEIFNSKALEYDLDIPYYIIKFRDIVSEDYSLIEINLFEKEIIELRKYGNLYKKRSSSMVRTRTHQYSIEIDNFFNNYNFQKEHEKVPIAIIISYIYTVRVNLYNYYLDY